MRGPDDLQRISLLLVLAGLSLMYSASAVFSPEKVRLADVGTDDVGEAVSVEGQVRDLSTGSETVFFRIEAGETAIRAVHFDNALDIEEGGRYTFQGRIDIYQGELEIVVDDASPAG